MQPRSPNLASDDDAGSGCAVFAGSVMLVSAPQSEPESLVHLAESSLWPESEPGEPAARSRSYSLRSPNRELRAARSPGSASVVMQSKTLAALNDHPALCGVGARTARFGERSKCQGRLNAAVAWRSKTLAALNNHSALCEAGVRTDRFGERSEYEGSRAPAPHSACFEETTVNAGSD